VKLAAVLLLGIVIGLLFGWLAWAPALGDDEDDPL
jgi:hypothetical protein